LRGANVEKATPRERRRRGGKGEDHGQTTTKIGEKNGIIT